jgi:acetoin utilization deacetylase AcuC-like enzyme
MRANAYLRKFAALFGDRRPVRAVRLATARSPVTGDSMREAMVVVYSRAYRIDIGTHVFPTQKYDLVYDRIRASGMRTPVLESQPASWQQLLAVHTLEYLTKLQTGDFDSLELAQLEVPWSTEIVEGFRSMTGGTIEAARQALSARHPRRAFHIGGGFHHAFANHGEGFCLFNDVAVTIRLLFEERRIERAAVIDLDVHHGNGTAFIFESDRRVFTFSMHQQHNYPVYKPRGSLDIGLADGTRDETYLASLEAALPHVVAHAPQIAFYLAGADPYEDDQLGGLRLTKPGLRTRDRMVMKACADARVPLVVLLAGGYARNLQDTVDIHYATFEEASGATSA